MFPLSIRLVSLSLTVYGHLTPALSNSDASMEQIWTLVKHMIAFKIMKCTEYRNIL